MLRESLESDRSLADTEGTGCAGEVGEGPHRRFAAVLRPLTRKLVMARSPLPNRSVSALLHARGGAPARLDRTAAPAPSRAASRAPSSSASSLEITDAVPIIANEIVLGIRLRAKGFDAAVPERESASRSPDETRFEDLMNDSGPAIQTRGLSRTLGGQAAVDGVDLSIREGELFWLSWATPWRSSAWGSSRSGGRWWSEPACEHIRD